MFTVHGFNYLIFILW